jgi:hypothetical protein
MPEMFRQMEDGPPERRGSGEKAEVANPSPESGRMAAAPMPVWKSLVDNSIFQKEYAVGIRAEQQMAARLSRDAARANREVKAPAWKVGEGWLERDGQKFDASELLNDPEAGEFAAKSLYNRDLSELEKDIARRRLEARDPSRARISDTERFGLQMQLGMDETDPETRKQIESRLADADGEDERRKELFELEKDRLALRQGGVDEWRRRRVETEGPAQRALAEKKAALVQRSFEKATQEEQELNDRLNEGVTAQEAVEVRAKLAEVKQARERLGKMLEMPDPNVEAIRRDAGQASEGQRRKARAEAGQTLMADLEEFGFKPWFTDMANTAWHKDLQKKNGKWISAKAYQAHENNPDDGAIVGGLKTVGNAIAGAARSAGNRLGQTGDEMDAFLKSVQAKHKLSDEDMKRVWLDLGAQHRQFEDGEMLRTDSTGRIILNGNTSDILRTDDAIKAIQESGGNEDWKKASIQELPAMQSDLALQLIGNYEASAAVFTETPWFKNFSGMHPGAAILSPTEWMRQNGRINDMSNAGDMKDLVLDYEDYLKSHSIGRRFIRETVSSGAQGFASAGVRAAGLIAAFNVGGEGLRDAVSEAQQGVNLAGAGASMDTGLYGDVLKEVPPIALQIVGARGISMPLVGGARALGAPMMVQSGAASLSAFVAAGAQSAGAIYAESVADGDSHEVAQQKAAGAGVATAILTSFFGTGRTGGVERLAAGKPYASVTMGQLRREISAKGLNPLKNEALRQFAKNVIMSSGGEATEEYIDELIQSFIQAEPDSSLADAWDAALQGGLVGGVIGGGTSVLGTARDKDQQQQIFDRINTAVAAMDPGAAAVTQEEAKAAQELANEGDGAEGIAQAVQFLREATPAREAATARVGDVQARLDEAKAVGMLPEQIAPMEAELQQAKVELAKVHRATGALKIAGGNMGTLTSAEYRALGMDESGSILKGKDLEAVGLDAPVIAVAEDGSPVLTDGLVDSVKAQFPSAEGMVKLTESEARMLASERADMAAVEAVEAEAAAKQAEAAPPTKNIFRVTGEDGASVDVEATSEADAIRKAIKSPGWPVGERADGAIQISQAPTDSLPDGQPQAPAVATDAAGAPTPQANEQNTQGQPGGESEAASQVPVPTVPAAKASQGDSAGGGRSADSATSQAKAPVKAGGRVRAAIAKAKKMLGNDFKAVTTGRVRTTDDGVVEVNVEALAKEAESQGFTPAQADQWISKVIDEELRHVAQHRASRALWESLGKPGEFTAWRAKYYGDLWRRDFLDAGKAADVRKLYGEKLDGMEPWQKAFEGLRMISQKTATGSPTEVARLWKNLTQEAIAHIRAALKSLKQMAGSMSAEVKSEISAIEAQLRQMESNESKTNDGTRGQKPVAEQESAGDRAEAGRPGGPRVDGAAVPPGRPRAGDIGSTIRFSRDGRVIDGEVVAIADDGRMLVKTALNARPTLVAKGEMIADQPSAETDTGPATAGSVTPPVDAVGEFEAEIRRVGVADFNGATYKITQGTDEMFFVQETKDGKRKDATAFFDSIEQAVQHAVRLVSSAPVDVNETPDSSQQADLSGVDAQQDAPAETPASPKIENLVKAYSAYHLARVNREAAKGKQSAEYYDGQRAEWQPEKVRARVEQFVGEIDSKDVAALTRYNNGMFDGFWKLFALRTGIKTPSTQKGIAEVIRSYVGNEAYDAHQEKLAEARKKKEEERTKKDEEWRISHLESAAKSSLVRHEGKVMNGKEFADTLLADGWRVENVSNGPVPRYQFAKDGRYIKNSKGFGDITAYAREKQKGMPDPVSEEDAAFDALPQEEKDAINGLFEFGGYKSPAPKLSEADQALIDVMKDLVDGLEAASLSTEFTRAIPTEKIGALIGVAQKYIAEGVNTPEAFAARVAAIADGKLVPFSQSLWGAFIIVDPTVNSSPEWAGIYESLKESAPEPSGFSEAKEKVMASVAADVSGKLLEGEKITVNEIKAANPLASTLTRKELDESIEAGITEAAHQIVRQNATADEATVFLKLRNLYEIQPSLNAKTSTSKINQAYSTPAPMAYVAGRLLNIDTGGGVLVEPTSGHGMLVMDVPRDTEVFTNEIDADRISRTKASIKDAASWTFSNEDGTTWSAPKPATKIISNPPFGSLMGESGDNIIFETAAGPTTAIDHAIMLKALENMAPDGRAVFIIGGPAKTALSEKARMDHYRRGARGQFFKHLHENYGVIDHFTVAGDLYTKQGAGWNVDIIVIQGKKPARIDLPSAKAPRMIASWDALFETTQLTDENRIQINRISEEDVRGAVSEMADALAGIRDAAGTRPDSARPDAGGIKDGSGRPRDGSATPKPAETKPESDSGTRDVDGRGDESTSNQSPRVDARADDTGKTTGDRGRNRGESDSKGAVRTPVKDSGKFQVEYKPFSNQKGLDTLLPKNMADPVADAFARIKKDLGENLTEFVREKLGYPKGTDITQYLAGEQIDAVAAAIWNFQRGGALIVGDQTGIGKGRIAAALIKYAVTQGHIPVFITKDPGLHDAMLTEDMPDIAASEIVPAVMDTNLKFTSAKNKKLNYGQDYFDSLTASGDPSSIQLPGDSNAVFVTYSQIQADDAKGLDKKERASARNNGQAPRDNWRMRALRRMAPNAVFILDESHLASGQSTTGWRVADVIGRSSRVYYSSATSVKRPENMGIYFKTNVGTLTGGNMEDLATLMNSGGVPAMQVVSSMLARDGQYLRRERSFDGVKFATQIAEESAARDSFLADNLTTSLREIVIVQDAMRQAADAVNEVIRKQGKRMDVPAANRAKLETVNFSSKLHNIVSQYLLAIKTQSVADTAIREIQSGKKVVVAVQSTMESAIDALEFGGFGMDYKGLVLRYLDQMRFLKSGNKVFGQGEVTEFELTESGLPEFEGKSDRDLSYMVVETSVNPETGDKVININEKVAAEIMRRSMWHVFQQARESISEMDLGDLPLSPIDSMRQAVERAGIRTGEITGRSRGIDENGEIYTRSAKDISKPARREAQAAFNNENLDFLVINQSGSTGISLHASEKAKNQATRVMIVAQPNLDINEFMQTLGRIHRSGQVAKPEFILLQTSLPAEKRPAAILGRKMAMLNANTTSNSKTDVSEGNTAVDIFNQYGDEVAYRVFANDPDLQRQLRPLGSALKKFYNPETGNVIPYQDAQVEVADQPDGYIARTITGYLAILPVEEQSLFWEKAIADYQAYISYLDQIGQNALEAKSLDLKAKTVSTETFTEKGDGDSAFDEASYIEKVETKIGRKPLTGEEALKISQDAKQVAQEILKKYTADAKALAERNADQKSKKALKPWTDEKRAEYLANQRDQRNTIANAITLIGRFGTVKRDDGNTGFGVIQEIKMDEAHLLTPSKQIAVIRVNDSRETLRVPVTQLSEAFTPDMMESAQEWNENTDIGGEAFIATGNLMAAMKELGGSGKVISYTTEGGADRMGILLPKTFMERRTAVKNRKRITSADQMLSVLDEGMQVTNEDGNVKWTKGDRLVSLAVPAARSRGGEIWRNPNINRMSIGGEFTQVGNEMRATFNLQNAKQVFDMLLSMGEAFTSPKSDSSLEAANLSDGQIQGDGVSPRYATDPNTGIKAIESNGVQDWNEAAGHLASQAARLLEVERPVGAEDGGPRPVTEALKSRLAQIKEYDHGAEAIVRIVRNDSVYRHFPIEKDGIRPFVLKLKVGPRGFILSNHASGNHLTVVERAVLANRLPGFRKEEVIAFGEDAVILRAPEMAKQAGEAQIDQWLRKHNYPQAKISDRIVILAEVDGQKWLIDDLHEENFRVAEDGETYAADFSALKISNQNAKKIFSQKTIESIPDELYAADITDSDATYLAAIERGDMETAQRMVDEAARKAGYDVGPMYHGTTASRGDFTVFKNGVTKKDAFRLAFDGLGPGWFTSSEEQAKNFGSRVIAANLKLEKPWTVYADEFAVAEHAERYTELQALKKKDRENSGNDPVKGWFRDGLTFEERARMKELYSLGANEEIAKGDSWEGLGKLRDEAKIQYPDLSDGEAVRQGLMDQGYDGIILEATTADGGFGTYTRIGNLWAIPFRGEDQIKSTDPVTYDNGGNVIPLSQRFNPARDSFLEAADINTEVEADALAEGRKRLAPLMGKDADRKEIAEHQKAFRKQGKVAGRPDLANPGLTEKTREAMDLEDEIRKFTAQRESRAQWEAEGRRRSQDPDKVIKQWVENAVKAEGLSGEEFGRAAAAIAPEDVYAIRYVMEDMAKNAGGDKQKIADAALLRNAYRSARSMIARSLAAGTDPLKTPAERARESIFTLITELPIRDMAAIENRTWKTHDAKKEAVKEATIKRLESFEKKFADMGITLEELLSGEVFLSLNATPVMQRITKGLKDAESMAVKMMQQGAGFDAIRRRTGMNDGDIDKVRAKMDADLRKALYAKVKAGMKLEDLRNDKGLEAAPLEAADLTEAEIQAELDRIIRIGFGIPAEIPKKSGLPARAPRVGKKRPRMDDEAKPKTAAEATIQRWIDKLAVSQSDTLSWKASKIPSELEKLIRAHVVNAVPGFIDKAVKLGTTADQARVLDGEATTERARRQMIADWRKANPKKRAPREKPKNIHQVDWQRPEFTEGLESYQFSTEERTDIIRRVVELRTLVGAAGRAMDLTGDKKQKASKLMAEINKTLAKHKLTVEDLAKGGMTAESYRFDINDRRHVAVIARTIMAMDAGAMDKIGEYYYSSLLSGLQTMLVNTTSVFNSTWNATVERGFESIANLFFQNPDNATFTEFKYLQKAMRPMLARAWSNAAATWSTEMPVFEEDILNRPPDLVRLVQGISGYRPGNIGGKKGRLIRVPTRVLMATDNFLNTARATAEVGAQAYRMSQVLGLKPGSPEFDAFLKEQVNTAGSLAWQRAAEKALAGSFMEAMPGQKKTVENPSGKREKVPVHTMVDALGSMVTAIGSGLTAKPTDKVVSRVMKGLGKMFFFPFVRVPYNITKQGVERTINPISAIDMFLLAGQNIGFSNGRFTFGADSEIHQRFIENFAKQIQGLVIFALLYGMAEGDEDDLEKPILFTGSKPIKETKVGERQLSYRMGLGPYTVSIRLPGGKRYSFYYGRIEPVATILGGTVDSQRAIKGRLRGSKTTMEATNDMLMAWVAQLNDKTSLRGMSDAMAILNQDRSLDRFTADRLAMIVPNIVRQAVRESDPYFRQPADNYADMVKYGMWPRGITPPRVDLYGEAERRPGKHAPKRMVDLTKSAVLGEPNPVDVMIHNWITKHGNDVDGVTIPTGQRQINYTHPVTGEKLTMTPGQKASYERLAGRFTSLALKSTPLNIENPSEADMKTMNDMIRRARAYARNQVFSDPKWHRLNKETLTPIE